MFIFSECANNPGVNYVMIAILVDAFGAEK